MELIFRILMYLIPFAIVITGYTWLTKRLLRLDKKLYRILGLSLVATGVIYTISEIVDTLPASMTEEKFNIGVILVNIFIMVFIAIILGIAEPEPTPTKKD